MLHFVRGNRPVGIPDSSFKGILIGDLLAQLQNFSPTELFLGRNGQIVDGNGGRLFLPLRLHKWNADETVDREVHWNDLQTLAVI